jgi:LuxR family maltose regulon positive regulatory protein
MTTSILTTKLFIPPIRSKYVPRSRLIKRLNENLDCKLTLISAPAGFGKTTLLSEWVEYLRLNASNENQIEKRIAWLSLDERDNDLNRFLVYFLAALRHTDGIDATFGECVLNLLQSNQQPTTEEIITSLINEFAIISHKVILIIDDYHTIDSSLIDDTLSFLLDYLPPQLHLIVATREDPQLSLARLRVNDKLTEFRAIDLRFTSSEVAEFLNQTMGLDLSSGDIAALETRTEGWIAGLQLAAISLQGQEDTSNIIKSFTGSHRLVLDYLIEEVLDKQPESIQTFLLQTAVLNRMTGSLCNALTGQDNGQMTLELLENANLFIVPLDEERQWYRYHHLFADLLLQRLRISQPEQVAKLHSLASVWFEKNAIIEEAIEHARLAKDFERVVNLLEEHLDTLWQHGYYGNILRYISDVDDELLFTKPNLCILQAWDLFLRGQYNAVEKFLQVVDHMIETRSEGTVGTTLRDQEQIPSSESAKIQGRAAVIRAHLANFRGNVDEILQFATQALECLPNEDITWLTTARNTIGDAYTIKGEIDAAYNTRFETVERSKETGDTYLILIANLRLTETLLHQGKLKQVINLCEQQMQYADTCGITHLVGVGWLLAIWGEALVELNHLDLAIEQACMGVELAEKGKRDFQMLGWSYIHLVRVLFSSGDIPGAEEIVKKIENIAHLYDLPFGIPIQKSAWQARLWIAQDNLEAASQWAEDRGLYTDGEAKLADETGFFLLVEYIVLARILFAKECFDETTRLLHHLLNAATAGGHTSRAIEILILQAMIYQAEDDTAQAITTLEKALTLAEPGGFIRIFIDEGPAMARLLYEALKVGISPDYISQLLAVFPGDESKKPDLSKPQTPKTDLVEPLSDREIEVLQLISEGLTNSEIGSRLFLSPNTVKAHARNIYAKIGVNNRTQAGAKARALGLLKIT